MKNWKKGTMVAGLVCAALVGTAAAAESGAVVPPSAANMVNMGALLGTNAMDTLAASTEILISDVVTPAMPYTYTGSQVMPLVYVIKNGAFLTEGTDYTLTYSQNIQVGTGRYTVTGINGYTGQVSGAFTILSKSIQDADVTATLEYESISYAEGFAREPAVTVKWGEITLTRGLDYIVTYANNINGGLATVTIEGIGNFSGTLTRTFVITTHSMDNCTVLLSQNSFTYNGVEQKPTVIVAQTNSSTPMVAGTDYEVTFAGDTVNVGSVAVTITGKGNYAGSRTLVYTISPRDITTMNLTVNPIAGQTYTGMEIRPTVSISGLTASGYDLIYSNNLNAGTAYVEIRGKGNYTGSLTRTFTINEVNLERLELSLAQTELDYNGTAQEPEVIIKGLPAGAEYLAIYTNNQNIGVGKVTIIGTTNCTGMAQLSFNIVPGDISNLPVQLEYQTIGYTGLAQRPKVTIEGLIEGVDFQTAYANNVELGQATVVVAGINNYIGSHILSFLIQRCDIATMDVQVSDEPMYWDGTEKTPTVTVAGLEENEDFIVRYSNNVNLGTATATVYGAGNYFGSVSKTFEIVLATNDVRNLDVSMAATNISYNGNPKEAIGLVLTNSEGVRLVQGTDYTAVFSDNVNAGTATVTVTGIGDYIGVAEIHFEITPKDITGVDVTAEMEYSAVRYTGETYEPGIALTWSSAGKVLVQGEDYTVTYANNTDAGTATVTIEGIGNYSGTIVREFNIVGTSLELFTPTLEYYSVEYTGNAAEPRVTIPGLVQDVDFTVTYTNNIEVGTAKVTIQGKGGYSGTLVRNFTVLRGNVTAFADVESDAWYNEAVTYVNRCGIMDGMGDGIFSPNGSLTREQFVTILARFSGDDLTAYQPIGSSQFTDMEELAWYVTYVQWASDVGVTNGMGDGTFGIGEEITRQDMAVMLMRYLELKGVTLPVSVNAVDPFIDIDDVADYAVSAVESMRLAALLGGYDEDDGEHSFRPNNFTTRAEAAKMMMSLDRLMKNR